MDEVQCNGVCFLLPYLLKLISFPGPSSALPSLSLTLVIDFAHCLYRSRLLSLILPHPLSLSHSLYLSLNFTSCSSISLASSPSLPRVLLPLSLISSIIYISTSLLSSVSNLFVKSSSHRALIFSPELISRFLFSFIFPSSSRIYSYSFFLSQFWFPDSPLFYLSSLSS